MSCKSAVALNYGNDFHFFSSFACVPLKSMLILKIDALAFGLEPFHFLEELTLAGLFAEYITKDEYQRALDSAVNISYSKMKPSA